MIAYLIIFEIVVFITYLYFIIRKFGVLSSISESWYRFNPGGYTRHLFTLFLILLGVAMFFHGSLWMALGGSFLCFTGGAANYKENTTGKIHSIGAVGGIAFALFDLSLSGILWPSIFIIVFSLLASYFKINNRTFWVEVVCFSLIEAGLIYKVY